MIKKKLKAQVGAATTGPRAPPTGQMAELRLSDATRAFTSGLDLIASSEVVKRQLHFSHSIPPVKPI